MGGLGLMTAIKQVSITTEAHVNNVGRYLNSEKALMRDSQHIIDSTRWAQEMQSTREAYGHNTPCRAGARNTFMYHQVLGFNPDECEMNGGKITAERAMAYAKEYVESRYPNQECVWVLHDERCKADGSHRYAVHIGINRTDLETGKRLNEGEGRKAANDRVRTIREMDEKHGLRQLVAGERNSRVHAMQPTRAEVEMRARGVVPHKDYIRSSVRKHMHDLRNERFRGNGMRELASRLGNDGIKMSVSSGGKRLTFEHDGFKVGGSKLGRGFSVQGIEKGLQMEAQREIAQGRDFELER